MVKHSKFRNPAILFELLVRQTTADLLQNHGDSKAVKILKKYYSNTELGKEYALYSMFSKQTKLTEAKAEMMISTVVEQRKTLNNEKLSKEKYNLIREIKTSYDIDNFFKAKIDNYKIYASIYTIFESINNTNADAKQIVSNKITLFEQICEKVNEDTKAPQSIVEEFMREDEEVRLIAYKILVEKFNDKYKGLSDRQKSVLKEYINNLSETENLKSYLNKTILEIKSELDEIKSTITDKVTQIRLEETSKLLQPIKKNHSVKDETISSVLQYLELIDTLKQS
jgi:hypothetical protein